MLKVPRRHGVDRIVDRQTQLIGQWNPDNETTLAFDRVDSYSSLPDLELDSQ